ncbi:MAG: MBL fold metallo-hydrolase [Bacteroidota bacterium]
MIHVKSFVFSPYQENTYVLHDETHACLIIDPGCYEPSEKAELAAYIESSGLRVEKLLNTHGHIDHVFGNKFVKDTYGVPYVTHKIVVEELAWVAQFGAAMGLYPDPSPAPDEFVEEGDTVSFGNTVLEVLFTPGHSPGHISFFHRESDQLFSGDVLFRGSIGRVDLPGGDYETLMEVIVEKVLPLGEEVTVYSGHGPTTTMGEERRHNPFILQYNGR